MALIKCPECEKEISDQAKVCIHCGCPIKKSKNKRIENIVSQISNHKKVLIIGASIILVVCLLASISTNKTTQTTTPQNTTQTVPPQSSANDPVVPTNLTIKDIVDTPYAWSSEGGIANPYDRYIFDLENSRLVYSFESSQKSDLRTYNMKFLDDKTIEISGLRTGNEYPATLTIVNENRLKITFVDDEYNKGDYYLNKTNQTYTISTGASKEQEENSKSNLTDDEERLLKYLKNSIDSFKNPASVRIIEVYTYDEEDDLFYVEISAENSLGGTTKELYQVEKYDIYESMSSAESIERMPFAFGRSCSCDEATLNDLLKEYYEEMGWD